MQSYNKNEWNKMSLEYSTIYILYTESLQQSD